MEQTNSLPEPRLNILTLGVNDLTQSIDFYERILGWPRMAWEGENIAFFHLNGMLLSLYPAEALAADAGVPAEGSGFRKFTLAYNTRSEAEVDAIIAHLEQQQVRIVKQPEKAFWGGYYAYFADPDGNLWEVAYNPFLSLDSDGSVSAQAH